MPIVRMFQGDENCGPVELQIVTGKPYQEIINNWPGGWSGVGNDGGRLGIPNDTPEDHYALLEKLKIPYHKINVNEVLNGNAIPNKTALLVHVIQEPKNLWEKFCNFFIGFFKEHWVVYKGMAGDNYVIDWGYWKDCQMGIADIRTFTKSEMKTLLKGAYPRCAYVVGEGQGEQSWIKRLFACFT